LGERPHADASINWDACTRETSASIGKRVGLDAERVDADAWLAAYAVVALTARRAGGEDDVVAHGDVVDAGSEFLDDPGCFMPHDDRQRRREDPVDDAEIRVAQAAVFDRDADLPGARASICTSSTTRNGTVGASSRAALICRSFLAVGAWLLRRMRKTRWGAPYQPAVACATGSTQAATRGRSETGLRSAGPGARPIRERAETRSRFDPLTTRRVSATRSSIPRGGVQFGFSAGQEGRSKRPAAPMPPPMHMLTMP